LVEVLAQKTYDRVRQLAEHGNAPPAHHARLRPVTRYRALAVAKSENFSDLVV
jgi:hypothetical protein